MADSQTSRYRARKQSLGSNTNTWGDTKLNDDLDLFDRGSKGYQATTITGDTTLTWTDYSTSNVGQVANWKLNGSLTSAATITAPSYEWSWDMIWNNTGAAITIKCSGGTGVSIPKGRKAKVYSDGADCYFGNPNYIGDDISEANNRDIADKAYVDTTCAAAAIPGATGTVKVDAAATAGYLFTVLTEGTGIDIADNGDTMGLSVDTTELEEFLALTGKITATLSSGTTAMTARRRYRISSTATGTLPSMGAGDFVIVEFTVGAGVTGTVGRNSQSIDGAAEDDTYIGTGFETPVVRYDYASAGAVTSRLIEVIP